MCYGLLAVDMNRVTGGKTGLYCLLNVC